MLMELALGGELFSLLQKKAPLSSSHAAFYVQQVACIFAHLQSKLIVYRDLKPENLLLDAEGYIKMIDFGFAKTLSEKTYTLCGTPEYLAPEVILNKGHTFSVDWWCIGILAYECLGCQTPFLSDSDMAMYRKIVKGPADGNISWPKSIPPDARDFIEAQINVDPLKRPGSMKDGALDVKTHKWLAQVDWKKAEARKLEAPWKPKIKSATDASNFDEFDDDAKENFPREDFAKDLFKEFADVWV